MPDTQRKQQLRKEEAVGSKDSSESWGLICCSHKERYGGITVACCPQAGTTETLRG